MGTGKESCRALVGISTAVEERRRFGAEDSVCSGAVEDVGCLGVVVVEERRRVVSETFLSARGVVAVLCRGADDPEIVGVLFVVSCTPDPASPGASVARGVWLPFRDLGPRSPARVELSSCSSRNFDPGPPALESEISFARDVRRSVSPAVVASVVALVGTVDVRERAAGPVGGSWAEDLRLVLSSVVDGLREMVDAQESARTAWESSPILDARLAESRRVGVCVGFSPSLGESFRVASPDL